MPQGYPIKIVTAAFNHKKGTITFLPIRLQKIALRTDLHKTRGYGLEVRVHEAQGMMSPIKAIIPQ
jgi:hypothetical protein